MTLEEAKAQMEEIKRLEFLKAEKEKSKNRLKVLTHEELEAQAAELAAYEMLGFSEWVEVHALASKVKIKSNGLLLKNLKAKFQWVKTQAVKLGIPPPPQLTAFKLPPTERKVGIKRKRRTELIHETFIKENIVVDRMQRNLTLLEGVVGKAGMVIKEPEAGIFLYNVNFDLVYDELIYKIESRPEFVQTREIVEKNLDVSNEDSLGAKHQRAVKDSLSTKPQRAPQTYSSQIDHQGSRRLLEDIWRVRGGNTLMILLPFGEEQAELSFSE
ncbi:hypothetical protein Tco_1387618 [Tanacetum coccineum]